MNEAVILYEEQIRAAISLDHTVLDAVENAFAALSAGGVVMPPILSMAIEEHNGEVDIKTAFVPGLNGFAIKISPGFFNNPAKGLASLNGMMVVLDSETGLVRALLMDNGYLTDVRTAAAGAIAAKHLARQNVQTVGVLGAGQQARLQLQALKLVREFSHVRVWARDTDKARAYGAEMTQALDVDVTVCACPSDVVQSSDIVVTTTPSRTPLIDASMLHPGLHITAMGSDAREKNEIAPAALAAADLYVPDRQSQTAQLGELHHAIAAAAISENTEFAELGDIITQHTPGRTDDQQITIADLTGTGVQDTAIADLAFTICRTQNDSREIHA